MSLLLPVYQFLHSGLLVKKFISSIIDFCGAVTTRKNMTWEVWWNNKVIGQFLLCLEATTSKCPTEQMFLWSWINPRNYVWTCMLMLNFSNEELVQKHLVQGISWNCIPGIGIIILSINQFAVRNTFALSAWQTKIFSARIWKINFQFCNFLK